MVIQKEEITKDLADKLMALEGETRGVCLKTDMEFLLREKGKEALRQMEEELEQLGYPLKCKEINVVAFYPIGQDILDILIIWRLFNFDKAKIKQLGYESANFSIFAKLFLKYFSSPKKTLTQDAAIALWRRHYMIGDVTVVAVDEEKKYIMLRIENFDIHPILCLALEGSFTFTKVAQLMVKGGKVVCQETKCTFRGDKYHEFVARW